MKNKFAVSILNKYHEKRASSMAGKVALLCDKNKTKAVCFAYYNAFYRFPNLSNPKTINEKLQVLKLNQYYNNDIITTCVDKVLVKDYLKKQGYGDLCAQTYWVGDNFGSVDFDSLPEQFVIKCNHGCGYNLFVGNKDRIDREEVEKTVLQWMDEDCWKIYAEFQYQFVEKKILIEQYLGDRIKTYKFYCFNGVPKVVYCSQADEEGNADRYLDYYDLKWNHLDIHLGEHPWNPIPVVRPCCLEKMIEIANELCKPFPFVRVDLYEIEGKVFFSEFTFEPTGGYMQLYPSSVALEWGEWLKI